MSLAFRSSFTKLLCSPRFNTMDYKLVMSIFGPKLNFTDIEPSSTISHGISDDILNSPISMRRLEAYVNKYADHLREKPVSLSYAQASVLLCMDLQNQDASYTRTCTLSY
nr:RNA cytidine acetyltransferase 1-like [Tanacetum cinerariifolium]